MRSLIAAAILATTAVATDTNMTGQKANPYLEIVKAKECREQWGNANRAILGMKVAKETNGPEAYLSATQQVLIELYLVEAVCPNSPKEWHDRMEVKLKKIIADTKRYISANAIR